MAVTLDGVKLQSLNMIEEKPGENKLSGTFHIMGSHGKSIAKQKFGGYDSDVAVTFSQETNKLIQDTMKSIQNDINTTLGLG